jgi:hypothetical protein
MDSAMGSGEVLRERGRNRPPGSAFLNREGRAYYGRCGRKGDLGDAAVSSLLRQPIQPARSRIRTGIPGSALQMFDGVRKMIHCAF